MIKHNLLMAGAGALTALSLAAGAYAFAQTGTTTAAQHMGAGVAGTVAAINGNSITLTGKDGTTYTVDAGSAAITKDETVSVSDIAVGDTLVADGTVSGTSVTATTIHDGKLPQVGFGLPGQGGRGPGGPGMGVRGTVSAINGSTLTVTAANPKDSTTSTYTVDASSASVMLAPTTAGSKPTTGSISSIKTGDTVSVMGAVSGTTVTAKNIIDGPFPMGGGMRWGKKPATTSTSPTTSSQ